MSTKINLTVTVLVLTVLNVYVATTYAPAIMAKYGSSSFASLALYLAMGGMLLSLLNVWSKVIHLTRKPASLIA